MKPRQQRNSESGRVEGERSRLDELLDEVPHCYVKEVLVRLGELCCPCSQAELDADFQFPFDSSSISRRHQRYLSSLPDTVSQRPRSHEAIPELYLHDLGQFFSDFSATTRLLPRFRLPLIDLRAITTPRSSSFDRILSCLPSHPPPSTRRFRFLSFARFAWNNDHAQSPCPWTILSTLLHLFLTAPFLPALSLIIPTLPCLGPLEIRCFAPSFFSSLSDIRHSTRIVQLLAGSIRSVPPE